MNKKIGLAPVETPDAEILILGTMPGDDSLKAQQYYANTRNRFWKVISKAFNVDLNGLIYIEKISILNKNHIALWDVLESADRKGSADANIMNGNVNDLEKFLKTHPKIKKIGFNGQAAYTYFHIHLMSKLNLSNIELVTLPSTSGANGYFKETSWINFLTTK